MLGLDFLAPAVVVEVLEEHLAAQLQAALHDAGDAAVGDRQRVLHAALAAELEAHLGAFHFHVAPFQRREPVGLVLLRQLLRPHPDQRLLEEPDHGGEHLGPRVSRKEHVALDGLADLQDHLAEPEHPLELRAVALRAEFGVVAVLLAPLRVARGHLQVSVLVRADPHLRPRRRDHERAEAPDQRAVADGASVRVQVRKAGARAPASNARQRVAGVAQPRGPRGLEMFVAKAIGSGPPEPARARGVLRYRRCGLTQRLLLRGGGIRETA